MTVPNVFESTSRVVTWDGVGIYDAFIAEVTANGAGNGITITDSTATGALIAFADITTDVFSIRVGATTDFIAMGIAGDGIIDGAGATATAPTGTGSDWSGEKERDWTIGTPGTGSKMWTVMLDDAVFIIVTDTANLFHTTILHFGRIYVPARSADDVANGCDGVGFMMGTPDALDNGFGADWLQISGLSAARAETGVWGTVVTPTTQIASAQILEPGGSMSHTPPAPAYFGIYVDLTTGFVGFFKYMAVVGSPEPPKTIRPDPVTNQGWMHFNDAVTTEDTVLIWDKTVTP